MLKRLLVFAVIVSFFAPSAILADQEKEAGALKAPNSWLLSVDAGICEKRWAHGSINYKNAVSKAQGETALTSINT